MNLEDMEEALALTGFNLLPEQDDGPYDWGKEIEVKEQEGVLFRRVRWRGEWNEWEKLR